MEYVKQEWVAGETVVTKTRMDHIEDGIALATGLARTSSPRASISWGTVQGSPYSVVRVFDALRPGMISKSFGGGFEAQGKTGSQLIPPAETLRSFTARTGYPIAANADGWRISGNTGEVRGPQIIDGVVYHDFGNANESPQGVEALGIRADGTYGSYSALDGDSAASMVADGVVTSFSYGPKCVSLGAERDLSTQPLWAQFRTTLSARQIIGFTADGALLLITVTGVSGASGIAGTACGPLALSLGAVDAWIMDGGGSAHTVAGGSYVMPSSDAGCERPVPSAMLVDAVAPAAISPWYRASFVDGTLASHTLEPQYRIAGDYFEFKGNVKMADGSPIPGSVADALKIPFRPAQQGIATAPSSGTATGKIVLHPSSSVNLFGDGSTTSYLQLEALRAPYLA